MIHDDDIAVGTPATIVWRDTWGNGEAREMVPARVRDVSRLEDGFVNGVFLLDEHNEDEWDFIRLHPRQVNPVWLSEPPTPEQLAWICSRSPAGAMAPHFGERLDMIIGERKILDRQGRVNSFTSNTLMQGALLTAVTVLAPVLTAKLGAPVAHKIISRKPSIFRRVVHKILHPEDDDGV